MDIKLALPNEEAKSAFLSSARNEMYSALSLFHNHVKYTISLMFALLTAVFAIFGIALKEVGANPQLINQFKFIGGLILSLLFPLGIVSIIIIARYYKLYVAALVYAAELHESVGLEKHLWFQEILSEIKSQRNDVQKENLIKRRTYGWPHSWILYSSLIGLISLVGLIAGITLLSTA